MIGLVAAMFFGMTAYANSSWHWVTVSPMAAFPVAVVLTLLIETAGISKFNHIRNTKKVFVIVAIANMASFAVPYLERAYRFIPTSGGYSITAAFDKGPYYMVLSGYLLLTLIIEMPIVFLLLRKGAANEKRLAVTILTVNVMTTAVVAVLERVICRGRW